MATLGAKLLKLRQEHQLSQEEISDILGVSQNAYSKWEADKCKPLIGNLYKISQYYQIDMDELLDESGIVNFSNNELQGEQNIFATSHSQNTVNIHSSKELIEKMLQSQEQITLLLDAQIKLISELLKRL